MRRDDRDVLTQLDEDVLRALAARGNDWVTAAELVEALELDAADGRAVTRIIAALHYLKGKRWAAAWRPRPDVKLRWTLTTTGELKVQNLDQLALPC